MATGYKIQAIEIRKNDSIGGEQHIFVIPGYERVLSVGYYGAKCCLFVLARRNVPEVGRITIRAYFDKECKVSAAIELEDGWIGSAFRPEAMRMCHVFMVKAERDINGI